MSKDETSYFGSDQEKFLTNRRTIHQLFKLLRGRAKEGDFDAWQILQDFEHRATEALMEIPPDVVSALEKKQTLIHDSFHNVTGWIELAIRAIRSKRHTDHARDVEFNKRALAFAEGHLQSDDWYHSAEPHERKMFEVHLINRWEFGALVVDELSGDSANDWAEVVVSFWEAECSGDWERSPLWKPLQGNAKDSAEGNRRLSSEFRARIKDRFKRAIKRNWKRFE
ncbi:hypothetical protein OAG85_01735 [Verrucomicrobiales bacterium]|nr:hypothetical protein [Verrucomicrobiales bacterium]MDB4632653.1 hypothetical protein [bacterium]MDB4808627.1 hypothetical protein [Verrucomicrobiales bacterium]